MAVQLTGVVEYTDCIVTEGYIEQVMEAAPKNSGSCTATYHPPWKLSKLDEPDMQDTAGDVGTSS